MSTENEPVTVTSKKVHPLRRRMDAAGAYYSDASIVIALQFLSATKLKFMLRMQAQPLSRELQTANSFMLKNNVKVLTFHLNYVYNNFYIYNRLRVI